MSALRRLSLVTAGESHGPGLTAILSGLPAGLGSTSTCSPRPRPPPAQYGRGTG